MVEKNLLDKTKYRNFAFLIGSVLFLIAGVFYINSRSFENLLILGAIFIIAGLITPKIFKIPYNLWMSLALILGWVMTRIILSILFFLIMTPISLISRINRRQFIELNWDKKKETYWNKREKLNREDKKNYYEKQF